MRLKIQIPEICLNSKEHPLSQKRTWTFFKYKFFKSLTNDFEVHEYGYIHHTLATALISLFAPVVHYLSTPSVIVNFTYIYALLTVCTISMRPHFMLCYGLLFAVTPKHGPQITGGQPRYQIDDIVRVNCTSAPSKPVCHLSWLINGVHANRTFLRPYDPIIVGREGLELARLGLEFRVRKKFFKHGDMKLKVS